MEKKRRPYRTIKQPAGEGGVFNRRQRLFEKLSEQCQEIQVPDSLVKVAEANDSMALLVLKMWWVTPNPFLENRTPQELWLNGEEDAVADFLLAISGDQQDLLQKVISKIRSGAIR
ncbi:MAG: hypothetical protein WAV56_03865 [Microgenomates group bacterium]